jgi:hypothetical protein
MAAKIKTVVSKQLPEFVREDYPAFLEFIQAYYDYVDQQQTLDVASVKDIDTTLDSFIQSFKNELDILGLNYQYIDERLFLRKSKELFSAKGTESSYKLLFKLLYNKNATISYPWDQVLKASDGKWQQETSAFIKMTVGNASEYVGNYVNVISGNAKLKVFVSRIKEVEDLIKVQAGSLVIGETYKIDSIGNTDFTLVGAADNLVGVSFVATGPGSGTGVAVNDKRLYEVFINKDYYGNIKIGDVFEIIQKQIVFDSIRNVNSSTASINYTNHGLETGDGVVYNYTGGKSIGGLQNGETYYIIKVDNDNFKLAHTLENSKTGINLNLSSPGIGIYHRFDKSVTGFVIPTTAKYTVVKKGQGFKNGDLINAVAISDGKKIESKLKVTRVDENGGILSLSTIQFGYGYTSDFFVLEPSKFGIEYTSGSIKRIDKGVTEPYSNVYTLNDDSVIEKYTDFGYIISPNYVEFPSDKPAYTDISYAATLLQQYYQEIDTSLGASPDFAIIKFDIGAIAKYPGQFITNDGFLDDDIYIQDSFRWQKYSYILTISEKLDAYKNIVKSLLHPSGTALFGEYQIAYTNNIGMLDGVFNVSDCEFTGSISGNILTVSFVLEDELQIGSTLLSPTGGREILPLTKITEFITGTGGVGTYRINKSQTLASQDILGRRPTVAGQNVQDLGQWRSEATFVQINKSIGNMFTYPVDQGGYIRYDPWDISYALESELYASPETYRMWGDERNAARSTLAMDADSIETDEY